MRTVHMYSIYIQDVGMFGKQVSGARGEHRDARGGSEFINSLPSPPLSSLALSTGDFWGREMAGWGGVEGGWWRTA